MTATIRQFQRRFSHFKRQAEAGKTLRLKDGQGRQFLFRKEKRRSFVGAAVDLFPKDGKPLDATPIPASEFKGGY